MNRFERQKAQGRQDHQETRLEETMDEGRLVNLERCPDMRTVGDAEESIAWCDLEGTVCLHCSGNKCEIYQDWLRELDK